MHRRRKRWHFEVFWRYFSALESKAVKNTPIYNLGSPFWSTLCPLWSPQASIWVPKGCQKAPKGHPKPPTDPPRAPFGHHFDVFWMYFSALEPKDVKNTILESFLIHFSSILVSFWRQFEEILGDVLWYVLTLWCERSEAERGRSCYKLKGIDHVHWHNSQAMRLQIKVLLHRSCIIWSGLVCSGLCECSVRLSQVFLRYSLSIPSVFLRYSLDIPQVFLRYSLDIPQVFLTYSLGSP